MVSGLQKKTVALLSAVCCLCMALACFAGFAGRVFAAENVAGGYALTAASGSVLTGFSQEDTQVLTTTITSGVDKFENEYAPAFVTAQDIEGVDGSAVKLASGNMNSSRAILLKFTNSVAADEVTSLTIRMYLHVGVGTWNTFAVIPADSTTRDGVGYQVLYTELSASLSESGYGWTDVKLEGENLAKIADTQGNIGGFNIVSFMNTPETQDPDPYIVLDTVTYTSSSFTVTFVVDGEQTQQTISGNTIPKPEDPVKFGYAFDGWYTDAGEKFDFSTEISSDITLTAKFSETPYALGETVLSDCTGASLLIEKTSLEEKYNDAIEANRLRFTEDGLEFLPHTDAYYAFRMKFLKSVDLEEDNVSSVYIKLNMNIVEAGNASTIEIFAYDSTDREEVANPQKKVVIPYTDLLGNAASGEVTLTLTEAQLDKLAVNGKIEGFNFAVYARGYTDVWCTPVIVIQEIGYSVPTEVSDYSAFAGTYYGNDGTKLELKADKSAAYGGETASYVCYTDGVLVLTAGDETLNGVFREGSYSLEGVTYFKYSGQGLAEGSLSDFAPWNVVVSETTLPTAGEGERVDSFYLLGNAPSFEANSDYTGGYAVRLNNGVQNALQTCKFTFAESLAASEIGEIVIRIRLNVGETPTSYISIYAGDAVARADACYTVQISSLSESGYGWVNIVIGGDDLAKVTDQNGNISGVNFMLGMNDSGLQANDSYVIVDDVTYKEAFTVSFDSDGNITSAKVTDGETVARPEDPEKDGYLFVCWMLNGEEFDFNTPITQDITLTASFAEVQAPAGYANVFYDADGNSLHLCDDGSLLLYRGGDLAEGMFACAANGTLVIRLADYTVYNTQYGDSIVLGGVTFTKAVSAHKVTYVNGSVSRNVLVGDGKTAFDLAIADRAGYITDGWYSGNEKFDFDTPVTADTTLTACYLYDEIDDYTDFLHSFYNEDGDTLLVFGEDNKLTILAGGERTELSYYVLTSDAMIIVDGTAETECSYNGISVTYNGISYALLRSYKVTFTSDGTTVSEVTVDGGEYTVAKPADPQKEGYTFTGWYEAGSQTAFDFGSVINRNVNLEARWERTSGENEPADSGDTGCSGSLTVAGGGTAAAVLLGAGVLLKKKKKDE